MSLKPPPPEGFWVIFSVINVTTESSIVSQTPCSCQRMKIPIDYSYLTLAIFLTILSVPNTSALPRLHQLSYR